MSTCLDCIVLFINFLKYILFYFSPGTRGGTKAWQLPYLTIQLTPLAAAEISLEQRVTPVTEKQLKQCERR